MAGKVAKEASITETKPKEITEEMSMENVAKEAAKGAVADAMKEITPLFQAMVDKLTKDDNKPDLAKQIEGMMGKSEVRSMKQLEKQFDRRLNENNRFIQGMFNAPRKDLRWIRIPRIYRKHIGSQLPVGLNGNVITIPVDGNSYLVHKDYLPIINQKLEYEDQKISYMEDSGYEDISEVDQIKV